MILLIALMVAWGVNFPLTKLGLRELPPLLMTTARFALTALLLLPFARPPVGQFRPVALGSAMTLIGVAIIVIRRPALAEPRP